VVHVIGCDSDLPDFTLYDVDFASGLQTLHGSELRPAPMGASSCHEKKHLLVAHNKAFDIYLRGVRELANAVEEWLMRNSNSFTIECEPQDKL